MEETEKDGNEHRSGSRGYGAVDEALIKVGGFGRMQRFVYFISGVMWIACANLAIISTLVSQKMSHIPWRCADPYNLHCARIRNASSRTSVLPCDTLQSGDLEFDDDVKALSYRYEWGLVCENEHLLGIPDAGFFFGFMFGVVAFGYFGDRAGRRKPVIVATILTVLPQILTSVAKSLYMYTVLRFFAGF